MPGCGPARYVGRFAPSPTGPLHFGSLLAAVASYLQARSCAGIWLLRVEDIDPPRQQEGATEAILGALERYGFEWDGPVCYQSQRLQRHLRVIDALRTSGHAYACTCSRLELSRARQGPLGPIYPGTCRNGIDGVQYAVRVRTHDAPIEFIDLLQGPQRQRLESESGDFVIRRQDGLIAYHLAVVVDDFDQGVTEIVRGVDLLDSTPRQIHLQRLLGFPTPAYAHIPVVENERRQKLSKQTGATPIPLHGVRRVLVSALEALGQRPPADLVDSPLDDIWSWSIKNWQPTTMAGRRAIGAKKGALAGSENGLS